MPATPIGDARDRASLSDPLGHADVVCCIECGGTAGRGGSTRACTSCDVGAQSGAQSGQSGAFFIETASGMLGSAIGIGIVGLASNCGVDDLGCVILTLGAGGTLGAIGATVGTTIAARHTGAPRSVIGAALGAVVGTGAGLGIHYLATQAGGSNLGDRAVVPIVIVSQGLMSAAGSRLLGR